MLPEKYDLKGSSGNVLTSVLLPRCMNSISGSPEISSENLVHLAHRMHLSLSRRIISEIGIGFTKCHISSTNLDSPGPYAIV